MAQKTVAISITSNRAKVESEVTQAINRALEICGGKAETYAKKLCPVDTGYLRNSIAHGRTGGKMSIDTYRSDNGGKRNRPIRSGKYEKSIPESDMPTMIIGTNVEYAPYVEFGTGVRGQSTNKNTKIAVSYKQDWAGQSAQPFLAPALRNNKDRIESTIFRKVIEGIK